MRKKKQMFSLIASNTQPQATNCPLKSMILKHQTLFICFVRIRMLIRAKNLFGTLMPIWLTIFFIEFC